MFVENEAKQLVAAEKAELIVSTIHPTEQASDNLRRAVREQFKRDNPDWANPSQIIAFTGQVTSEGKTYKAESFLFTRRIDGAMMQS